MLYKSLISTHLNSDHYALYSWPDGRTFTYSQLDAIVKAEAQKFISYGLQEGHHVVIQNTNTPETIIHILTCIYLGLCFVLVQESESIERINYIISDSQSRLAILGSSHSFYFLSDNQADSPKLTYILYTSGSTGRPKGVMAPETQVTFCTQAISNRLMLNSNDIILCCLPLSFDYGLYQLFMSMACGGSLVLIRNTGAFIQSIPGLIAKYNATIFPTMPAMLRAVIKSGLLSRINLDCLRCITSTGDTLPVELIHETSTLIPHADIVPMYGLTECKRVSVMPLGRTDKIQAGSCGLPLDGTSVRLAEDGELIISGPNVMAGYWNDAELTRQYFFDDQAYGKSLRSGDIFRIDDEGFLYFCGRKKNILKVDGIRVSATEIEHDITQHIGDSADIRVIGIDDAVHGEKLIVCAYSETLTKQQFIERLHAASKDWPHHRKISGVLWLKSPLPINNNGKTDTAILKAMALEHHDTV